MNARTTTSSRKTTNALTAAHAPTTEVRRALSPLERWYWIADQVSPLNVIARVQVRGPLPPVLLRAALDRLRQRHPLLRVAIAAAPDGRSPRFVSTDRPIPLEVGQTAPDAGRARRRAGCGGSTSTNSSTGSTGVPVRCAGPWC